MDYAHDALLFPSNTPPTSATAAGFRFGSKGTHTSRTIMLDDLREVMAATARGASRTEYAAAIIEANCLSKPTVATRRLSNQRLGELYALDPKVPLFRVVRRLWDVDAAGRPSLAVLAATARDPVLAATCPVILALSPGAELQREQMRSALRTCVGNRLNENVLDKVIRNAASSWAQSGHLQGRTFKKRRAVTATPASAAYAMYLAHAAGFRGADIFASGWLRILDCTPADGRERALEAKRLGLIDLRMAGDVIELKLGRLDPTMMRA